MPKASEEKRVERLQKDRNQESQNKKPDALKKKGHESVLNPAEAVLLIIVAAFCDLITFVTGLIPGLGSVVGAVIWLGFFLWIKFKQLKGAPRFWSKLNIIGGVAELIPMVGSLPFWLGISLIIVVSDKTGNAPVLGKISKAVKKVKI